MVGRDAQRIGAFIRSVDQSRCGSRRWRWLADTLIECRRTGRGDQPREFRGRTCGNTISIRFNGCGRSLHGQKGRQQTARHWFAPLPPTTRPADRSDRGRHQSDRRNEAQDPATRTTGRWPLEGIRFVRLRSWHRDSYPPARHRVTSRHNRRRETLSRTSRRCDPNVRSS